MLKFKSWDLYSIHIKIKLSATRENLKAARKKKWHHTQGDPIKTINRFLLRNPTGQEFLYSKCIFAHIMTFQSTMNEIYDGGIKGYNRTETFLSPEWHHSCPIMAQCLTHVFVDAGVKKPTVL